MVQERTRLSKVGWVWERWRCGQQNHTQHREPSADGSKCTGCNEKFRNGLSLPISFLFLCPGFFFYPHSFHLLSFRFFCLCVIVYTSPSVIFLSHKQSYPSLHRCIPWLISVKCVPFKDCLNVHSTGNLECFKRQSY